MEDYIMVFCMKEISVHIICHRVLLGIIRSMILVHYTARPTTTDYDDNNNSIVTEETFGYDALNLLAVKHNITSDSRDELQFRHAYDDLFYTWQLLSICKQQTNGNCENG